MSERVACTSYAVSPLLLDWDTENRTIECENNGEIANDIVCVMYGSLDL